MRKSLLVASSAATVLAAVPNDEYGQAFEQFEARHHKVYKDEQERFGRFHIFKDNYKYIAAENAKGTNTYELGVNDFSDMTKYEFAGTHFGYVKATQRFGGVKHLGVHEYKGSMEGAWKIASGNLVSLSEEQLVACSKQNNGCQGGSMELAFTYEEGTKVCTEQSYPYTSGGGSVGACQASSCTAGIPQGGITGYKTIASNVNALMSAVAQQPISIAVEADKAVFQSYRSGVMTGNCGTNLDHGILAIGYGTDSGKDYWLVKNSWGSSWGISGYGKLERGKGGTGECGILSDDSYPVASGSPGPSPGPSPPAPPSPPPSPAPVNGTHYGNPADGCLSDEDAYVPSRVTRGIPGTACAHNCIDDDTCAAAPAGATAKAGCLKIMDAGGGVTDAHCVLQCSILGGGCPKGSQCKGIGILKPFRGMCTYKESEGATLV